MNARWCVLGLLLLAACSPEALREAVWKATDHYNFCILTIEEGERFYTPELDGTVVVGDMTVGNLTKGCVVLNDKCGKTPTGEAFVVPAELGDYKFTLSLGNVDNWCVLEERQFDNATVARAQLLSHLLPYVKNIRTNDDSLKATARQNTRLCNNDACKAAKLFYHVVDNYKYIADPTEGEDIKVPSRTLADGGGDCEDLGALLQSYLENAGVETYTVLTVDHAYALACNIDLDRLGEVISAHNVVTTSFLDDDSYTLDNLELRIYEPFEQPQDIAVKDIRMHVQSSAPIDVILFPSMDEFENYRMRERYSYIPACSVENDADIDISCPQLEQGYLMIGAPHQDDVTIDVTFNTTYTYNLIPPEDIAVTHYVLNGKNCVVMDPTTGNYSYPGYQGNLTPGSITAINPRTFEVFDLA